MIQQPELGKKIADLRKAKGLTQEELVEKCNLNVRTLQRIECGEVTPRPFTVKLIFEALDLNYNSSFENPFGIKKRWISKWPGQFYINFIDLFNLKTNTMKKITILSIMLSVIIKGLFIGRDVTFRLNGVKVKNIRLMVIDEETREFDALFVQGQFLERKVTIDYQKEWLVDGDMQYSADNVDKSDSRIILKGHARVYDLYNKDNPDDDASIEADEVTINLK